jgi:hypothetical protein
VVLLDLGERAKDVGELRPLLLALEQTLELLEGLVVVGSLARTWFHSSIDSEFFLIFDTAVRAMSSSCSMRCAGSARSVSSFCWMWTIFSQSRRLA